MGSLWTRMALQQKPDPLSDEKDPINTEMDLYWPLVSFIPGTAGSLSHLLTAGGHIYAPPC